MYYGELVKEPEKVKKLFDEGYSNASEIKIAKDYYNGDNTTISKIKKEVVIKSPDSGKYEKVQNPFVSNNKIQGNIFLSVVDQPVFKLLSKSPKVEGFTEEISKKLSKKVDYALQNLAVESRICGTAFALIETGTDDRNFNILTFDTEDCIPFYDDKTGELKALAHMKVVTYSNKMTKTYIDIYDQTELTRCEQVNNDDWEVVTKNYRVKIVGNDYTTEEIPVEGWGFPIIELSKDKDRTSDFTEGLRCKIDIIDLVMSDYANNLSDFQEMYWVIKGISGAYEEEKVLGFIEEIKNTNKVAVNDDVEVENHQIEIPHEAKLQFIDLIKKQIVEDCAMLNTDMVLTGNLTATAIEIASEKLNDKVNKFEYFVYNATLKALAYLKIFLNDKSNEEIDVIFRKSGVSNNSEKITNLLASSGILSKRTILEQHPYVEDVEEELQRLKEEASSSVQLIKPADLVTNNTVIEEGGGEDEE